MRQYLYSDYKKFLVKERSDTPQIMNIRKYGI